MSWEDTLRSSICVLHLQNPMFTLHLAKKPIWVSHILSAQLSHVV